MNQIGTSIINGLKKVFVIKIKRRNAVFYKNEEGRKLVLTNLRNKRFFLNVSKTGEKTINGQIFDWDDDFSDMQCILLSRDAKMLESMCPETTFQGKNLFEPEILKVLFNLLESVDDFIFDELHPVNRS